MLDEIEKKMILIRRACRWGSAVKSKVRTHTENLTLDFARNSLVYHYNSLLFSSPFNVSNI